MTTWSTHGISLRNGHVTLSAQGLYHVYQGMLQHVST